MSRIVLVRYRTLKSRSNMEDTFAVLNRRLSPDNIEPRAAQVLEKGNTLLAILNPNPAVMLSGMSAGLGHIIDGMDRWAEPLAPVPDGAFALFRCSDQHIELVADETASRTIWFVKTDEMFVASTSQRAIVMFLGSFEPNRSTYSWMLSAGRLGPGLSWDARIASVLPAGRVTVDLQSWEFSIHKGEFNYDIAHEDEKRHASGFLEVLEDNFAKIRIENARWTLLLSGGFDSRGILMLLNHRERLQAITWGSPGAEKQPGGDVFLARQLCQHFGLRHRFFPMNLASSESVRTTFDRFLVAGEGRNDAFGAYLDGLLVWKTLYEEDAIGVLRGDVAFGWNPVRTEKEARMKNAGHMLSDIGFTSLADLGLGEQVWPDYLQRRPADTLEMWRDRMEQWYAAPVGLAALNDIKSAYVELVHPYLSRSILHYVRTMPDSFRTGKALFTRVIASLSPPDIGFASERPPQDTTDLQFTQGRAFMDNDQVVTLKRVEREIDSTLSSESATVLLSRNLLSVLEKPWELSRRVLRSNKLPNWTKEKFSNAEWHYRRLRNPALPSRRISEKNLNRFKIRAYVIVRMNEILCEDARMLR